MTDFTEKVANALAEWSGDSWLRHYLVLIALDLFFALGIALICLGGWNLLAPTEWRLF